MDILHTSGTALEGHDLLNEWTGFMNLGKRQRRG
jgi:hypothetical protein